MWRLCPCHPDRLDTGLAPLIGGGGIHGEAGAHEPRANRQPHPSHADYTDDRHTSDITRLGAPREDTVLLDDVEANVDGACAVGLRTVTFANNRQAIADLHAA